jgi:CDP-6-deoxy-D-xylo-4-hexulose-3-dehydrase
MKSTFHNEAETKRQLAEFILKAEILSMNEQCQAFECSFAAKQGRKHAAFVSSGSQANLILVQALLNMGRLKKGDRVGVSALTWSTNIMPLLQLGLTPVLLDVERDTLNVGVDEITRRLPDIDALFLTNALGFASDLPGIRAACLAVGKLFIEDNCESLGSRMGGELFGNFGLASTFSTFVGHHLSTIEGGLICTDDDELWNMIMVVRAHGWGRNLPVEVCRKYQAEHGIDDFYARYTFFDIGLNGRNTEIGGFIGNRQIGYWDEIVNRREANFKRFVAAAAGNDDLIPLRWEHMDLVSNFAMPVLARTEELAVEYRNRFAAADVEIRPIIAGDMREQPFFKKHVGSDLTPNPGAAFIHRHGFYFPNNQELTAAEIELLCGLLRK